MIAQEMPDFLALLMGDPMPAGAAVQLTARIPARALHYSRCRMCTEIVTTAEPLAPIAVCDCSAVAFEYLGKAKGSHLVREEDRCACDARCTSATGPNCDCICAGANHGTGRLVTVEILSGIPRVRLADPGAARARRKEFEEECDEVNRRLANVHGAHWSNFKARAFVQSRTAWLDIRDALAAKHHAKSLRNHRNRIAALKKIAS